MFSGDPQQLYKEALQDEGYTKSPDYLYKKLYDNHQYFEPLRNIRDAGILHEHCQRLAQEMSNYPDHKAWKQFKKLNL